MFWLLNLLFFVTAVLIVFIAHAFLFERRGQVSERLSEIQKIEGEDHVNEEDVLKKPFSERIIRPFFQKLGESLGNLTPKEIRNSVEKKIIYAGSPRNLNFNRFVTSQVVLGLVLSIIPLVLFPMFAVAWDRTILIAILLGLMGFLLPWFSISSQAAKRQLEIQKSLPDVLDLLLVSVEAGLGFDMALKRVAEQAPGTLSREFGKALEEIRMGKPREEAMRGIVRRTGVADLSSFITAVIQSEQLGTNIANTLRIQANTMRQKRRQRAEEAAMKAPIKMLFPLVFFIFPVMFVVLLGPALIQIITTLGAVF